MSASICTLVAAIVWIAMFVVSKFSSQRNLVKAIAESLGMVAATFFCVGLFYVSLEYWITAAGGDTETTATVKAIENTIANTRTVILPYFSMSDWTRFGLLVVLVFLALIGAGQTVGLIFAGLARYGKLRGRVAIVLTALVSFSFFQGQLNQQAEARIAQLRSSLNQLRESAAVLKQEAEETALDIVIDEVIDQPSISIRIRKVAALVELQSKWQAFEDRSRSTLRDRFPEASSKARLEFFKAEVLPIENAHSKFSHLAEAKTATSALAGVELVATDSKGQIEGQRDVMSGIREFLIRKPGEPISKSEEIARSTIRHALKMGYKSLIGGNLEKVIVAGIDGIPKEIVKLILDPAVLEPIRDKVLDTADKLLRSTALRIHQKYAARTTGGAGVDARARKTMGGDIYKETRGHVGEAIGDLDWTAVGKQADRLDVSIQRSLARGQVVHESALRQITHATAKAIRDVRWQMTEVYNASVVPSRNEDLRRAARTLLGGMIASIDAKTDGNDLERLIQYRDLHAQFSKTATGSESEKLSHLISLEGQYAGTSRMKYFVDQQVASVLSSDEQTRWGGVRSKLTKALNTGQLHLEPQSMNQWRRIWPRWQEKEREVALELVADGVTKFEPKLEVFDGPFRSLLTIDPELAGIWGFMAKSFIDPQVQEEYFKSQFPDYDTSSKVRNKIDAITYYAVMEPAIKDGAASEEDAIRKLESGKLDQYIDFERIKHVIRERGMIPHFGLDHYLKTTMGSDSQTSAEELLNSIVKTETWDRTISEHCD